MIQFVEYDIRQQRGYDAALRCSALRHYHFPVRHFNRCLQNFTEYIDEMRVMNAHCPDLLYEFAVIHVVEKALNIKLYNEMQMRTLYMLIGLCNSVFR